MSLTATCATITALLASAQGGEIINLKGNCTTITISKQYRREVTINAGGSSVAGLVVRGTNVRWRGGKVSAKDGAHGRAGNGYAVLIHQAAANIRLEGVTITAAKKGVVVDQARNVAIVDSKFVALGEDGMIVSRVNGLTITGNQFGNPIGKPTECLVNGQVQLGLAKRNCAGVWKDGYHSDAIQMRNGVVGARIALNLVEGKTQGITQMDTTGDAPLQNVTIENNTVRTDNYHHISLGNCIGCSIMNNQVQRAAGSPIKAIIRPGMARRCGNKVQDERVQDGRC
ncbi:MAG: right-handed parallel beta-helix repeat-containing protein [Sphingopyxis sp.]|nr:right-handed parallel beta-helix repeat-containing protein [Sphingopyxis sp.]